MALEDIGRWVFLGAMVAQHGEGGEIDLSESALARVLRVPKEDIESVIKRQKNVSLRRCENDNGKFSVTFDKWRKYQHDSTAKERQQTSRTKRRGEEKRGEETIGPDLFGQSKAVQKGEEKAYVMRDPGQQVVGAYKILTGVDLENREWDRMYYSRFKKNAEELLKFFHGSVEACCECMEQVKKWADIRKLDWNFNTVIKRAADVKSGRLWKNG